MTKQLCKDGVLALFLIAIPLFAWGQQGAVSVPGLGDFQVEELPLEVGDVVFGAGPENLEQPLGDLSPIELPFRAFVHPVPSAPSTEVADRDTETPDNPALDEVPHLHYRTSEEREAADLLRVQIESSPPAVVPEVPPRQVPTGPGS